MHITLGILKQKGLQYHLKIKYFWLFFLFLFMSVFAFSQNKINFGVKAGLNRSQVLGDGYNGYYKNSFNGGLFMKLRIQKKLVAQLEILFSDKGSHFRPKDYNRNLISEPYRIRLYYIDFPFMLQYFHKKIIYEIGVSVGYLRDQKEYSRLRSFNDVQNRFSVLDPSFNVGIGYVFNDHLGINLRFTNSIVPIRRVPSEQYNSLFTLSVFYQTSFKK